MIYQKKGQDNKTHLYKTANDWNVTSNDDVQLTYKDADNKEIDIKDYVLYYNGNQQGKQTIKASAKTYTTPDDIDVNVLAGDEVIFGEDPSAKENEEPAAQMVAPTPKKRTRKAKTEEE